jgi:prepilin-type N-terminal cleavage/methylation domain-containing protein
MRKKGFTLVELLVVIAIIALLMGILMPALARVRTIAYRMVCGTNLSGLGKAVLMYANDSKESYPMPGITNMATLSQSGKLGTEVDTWADCLTEGPRTVYAGGVDERDGMGTIGSLFYLLVKYEDVSVKQFNCKGDTGVKTFKLTDYPCVTACTLDDLTKVWDFGTWPGGYSSYSYHSPFAISSDPLMPGYPVTSNSSPSAPLAADRNPSMDTNVNYIKGGTTAGGTVGVTETGKKTPYERWTDASSNNSYKDPDLLYNSFAHLREGQNVLFNDGHSKFETTANVGIDNDNIWQKWTAGTSTITAKPLKDVMEAGGYFPVLLTNGRVWSTIDTVVPSMDGDALLINEPQNTGAQCP